MAKSSVRASIPMFIAFALAGCAMSPVYEQTEPPRYATILASEEWDSCKQQPGAMTRNQSSPASAKATQIAAGSLQGASYGVIAGAAAGVATSNPVDLAFGALAGAATAIVFSGPSPESCYNRNRFSLEYYDGSRTFAWATKDRHPAADTDDTEFVFAVQTGALGTAALQTGAPVIVLHFRSPNTGAVYPALVSDTDFQRYQHVVQNR